MNQKLSFLVLFVVALLCTSPLAAQTPATKPPLNKATVRPNTTTPVKPKRIYYPDTVKNTDFSLNGQYNFMLSRSRTVNGYKMVNPYRLNGLWQSVSDTLKKERQQLQAAKAKVAGHEKTIAGLQADLNGKETSLNDHNLKLNEISFLGLTLGKTTYHLLVWSIIGILAIALAVVIARSAKNILEARHRTQLYEEISAEYQAFKTRANEKERKLARELQDERNLVEELKGRS